jgi:hypothetical protein
MKGWRGASRGTSTQEDRMLRTVRGAAVLLGTVGLLACQSPTDPDEVTDFIDVTVSPDPAGAVGPTGRTYKVEGDGDDPDEIREYDWKATFTLTVTLTEDAQAENVELDFPVDITAATVRVQQASGGIITPPTGGETERYDFVIAQATSNRFVGINNPIDMTFEVWYDLPSLRKEALVNVTLSFEDDSGATFTEVVPVRVAP